MREFGGPQKRVPIHLMAFSYEMLSSQICDLCEKGQTDEEKKL